MPPVEYMNAVDAARYLGVTRQRIYELAASGRLGTRLAGYWVFTPAELDAYRKTRAHNHGGRPPAGRSGPIVAAEAPVPPRSDPYLAAIMRFAFIQRLPSGRFVGESLDFPGVSAEGSTRAECERALTEVLQAAVAAALCAGAALPAIDGVEPPRP